MDKDMIKLGKYLAAKIEQAKEDILERIDELEVPEEEDDLEEELTDELGEPGEDGLEEPEEPKEELEDEEEPKKEEESDDLFQEDEEKIPDYEGKRKIKEENRKEPKKGLFGFNKKEKKEPKGKD